MNTQPMIDRLATESSLLRQVRMAESNGGRRAVDTAAQITTLFMPLVVGGCHPLVQPDPPVWPNLTYQLVSSVANGSNGYAVTYTDTYVLSLRAKTVAEVVAISVQLADAIDQSAWAIEVSDLLMDRDDEQQLFRVNIQIDFHFLASLDQAMPAALLYPVRAEARSANADSCARQQVTEQYAVVLVRQAQDPSLDQLRTDVQAALLGYVPPNAAYPVQYAEGDALTVAGGMQSWQEIYSADRTIPS